MILLLLSLGLAVADELPKIPYARIPTLKDDHAPAASSATLVVEIVGLRSLDGGVGIAVYSSSDGFPTVSESASSKAYVDAGTDVAQEFAVSPGDYAVSAYHDEDGDHRLATHAMGAPKEGFGVSLDARSKLGPPRFEDAKVHVGAGERRVVRLNMRY